MSDIPNSPRKTVSSMSANARTQQPQKKPGAPKPKGAVRAKSGCYTCRIRRKKCDEQPNQEGACQTCVRLRLQCLGFGAKRPDWMRENNSVTELREKIKTFLASQGMIKGHSGSGPRSNDGDPPVLVLVENLQAQPASPPTPTLSNGLNEPPRQSQGPTTSYVRDPRDPAAYHHPSMPPSEQQPHSYAPQSQQQPQQPQTTWAPHLPELTSHSHPHPHDASMGRPMLPNDILFSTQPNTIISSASLVNPLSSSAASSSWPSSTSGFPSASAYTAPVSATTTYVAPAPLPTMSSRFSELYTIDQYGPDDDLMVQQTSPEESHLPRLSLTVSTFDTSIPHHEQELVQHYMSNVLPIQYLLSDQSSIRYFIYDIIRSSALAREAACTLAAFHRNRIGWTNASTHRAVMPVEVMFKRLLANLFQKKQKASAVTEGDAMAGLHAISTVLFAGGRGAWDLFLSVACQFVHSVLTNQQFLGPEEVMKHCNESTRFIIKTTMWFDVLASVTRQCIPQFLKMYRELFDPLSRAYIEDPNAFGAAGGAYGPYSTPYQSPPETSMLPVMGCENNIVLAIAEISNLAAWKESQKSRNCLSVPKLVELGRSIENKFLNTQSAASSPVAFRGAGGLPPYMTASAGASAATAAGHGMFGLSMGVDQPHGPMPMPPHLNGHATTATGAATMGVGGSGFGKDPGEVELRRSLTNDIFRASARLYLHTVLSGDYPSCPEIIDSVTDVIECLKRIPRDRPLVSRSVLRSVVFGICIAGCLTDNHSQREFLKELLVSQERESVGNIAEVKKLMEEVWARREHSQGQSVNWRDVMRNSQRELLLLV